MILEESAPSLRGRFVSARHVFADAAFGDVDAKFEQFGMDAGCTPKGILPAHFADQIAHLARNDRSSRSPAPYFPGPEPSKRSVVPTKDGFRLDDGQRRAPIAPDARETNPEQTVARGQFRAFCGAPLKHADLVAQGQVLELHSGTRTQDRTQDSKKCPKKDRHQ